MNVQAIAPSNHSATPRAAQWEPVLLRMSEVTPQTIQWLWPRRIPIGAITLIVGAPGVGKSLWLCDLAARVSRGGYWPDLTFSEPSEYARSAPNGSVILVSAEDDPRSTLPRRLKAAKADLSKVHVLQSVRAATAEKTQPGNEPALHGAPASPGADSPNARPAIVSASPNLGFSLDNLEPLRLAIEQIGDVRLVAIDPIGSYLGAGGAGNEALTRQALAPLAAMAERHGLAVVLVAHRRKALTAIADDLALGSRAFTAIARSVLHLARHHDDPEIRLLLPGKCNLSVAPPAWAFYIRGEPAQVEWCEDPIAMSADDAVAYEKARPGRPAADLEAATQWLEAQLADRKPHAIESLKLDAKFEGFSWRTAQRAHRKLKVHTLRTPDGASWCLEKNPKESFQDFLAGLNHARATTFK
jgi:putative DNA primase/helicase